MLAELNAEIAREPEDVAEAERSAANLEDVLLDAQEELKATKRQRVRDIIAIRRTRPCSRRPTTSWRPTSCAA